MKISTSESWDSSTYNPVADILLVKRATELTELLYRRGMCGEAVWSIVRQAMRECSRAGLSHEETQRLIEASAQLYSSITLKGKS